LHTNTPARGADIGWLSQLEALGYTWVDSQGNPADPIDLLKSFGVDSIRLRVMVDPGRTNYVTTDDTGKVTSLLGYCDAPHVLAMAQRCHSQGLKIFVDFHLSDTWADPAKQFVPAAWVNDDLDQLKAHIADHVTAVLSDLKALGITSPWVQIGNEIPAGLLWGTKVSGKVEGDTGWPTVAALVNAGYDAIKAVSPSSLVVLHLDRGFKSDLFRWWFDSFQKAGGKWDVVGASFYPYWQPEGTVAQLEANLNDMVTRYGKSVMVGEVGGLASDPVGTAQIIADVRRVVARIPDGRGLGVFYWEPEASVESVCGYLLTAAQPYGDKKLQFTAAMAAFSKTEVR
jgi:arabinogalactan endo-1,4-beta-galactosidase